MRSQMLCLISSSASVGSKRRILSGLYRILPGCSYNSVWLGDATGTAKLQITTGGELALDTRPPEVEH